MSLDDVPEHLRDELEKHLAAAEAAFSNAIPAPAPLSSATFVNLAPRFDSRESWVVLQWATPAGTNYYFLDADNAEQIGRALIDKAAIARSGLIIPDGVTMEPREN